MKILIGFILIGVSFATLDPAQEKFIGELNGIRKKVAANLTITNMHKLEYSKELAGMAERLVGGENVTGFHESWRHTWFENYKKGGGELLEAFDNYYKKWTNGQPPNKNVEVKGYARPVEHLIPLQTKIGCAVWNNVGNASSSGVLCFLGPEGSLKSFYTSLYTPKLKCSPGYLFIDGLCSPEDVIEVNYGSATTQEPVNVTENSQSLETTTASQDLETLKPEDPLLSAPPVGSKASKTDNSSMKTSNQTGDSSNPTVNSKITPSPIVYVPPTTVETELDRLIAKYQREEQDGDAYDEDFPTTVVSSKNDVSIPLKMTFVFVILGLGT